MACLNFILRLVCCSCNEQNKTYTPLKHSDWLRLRLMMDQSQEILLGHAIFASSKYRMTQLPSYCVFD